MAKYLEDSWSFIIVMVGVALVAASSFGLLITSSASSVPADPILRDYYAETPMRSIIGASIGLALVTAPLVIAYLKKRRRFRHA